MIRRLSLLGLVAALLAQPARAWDPPGHMLVAQIACDQLKPTTKSALDAALARFNQKEHGNYDIVTAACWMDDIRSRTKDYNLWHYVDLPFTPDGHPFPSGSPDAPNVVWGIQKCEDILAGKSTDAAIDKDQALVMLLHLVGDVHQPLHATGRPDDAGGNKVKIGNLRDPDADLLFSKGGNLHWLWDSAYRRIFKDGAATVAWAGPIYPRERAVEGHKAMENLVRQQATLLEQKYPPTILAEQGDPVSWAKESHALGYSLGYGTLPSPGADNKLTLPSPYIAAAHDCAEKRIALAGYRLGALLNRYFAPAATPTPAVH
jgi:hypothetical protein